MCLHAFNTALFGLKIAALKSCGSERLITIKIQEGVTGTSWSILTNEVVKVEFWINYGKI